MNPFHIIASVVLYVRSLLGPVTKHIPIITAIMMWPILGGILKHYAMDGSGPIWPFMIVSAAVTFILNRPAGVALGLGILASQGAETYFQQPLGMQVGVYAIIAFVSLAFLDKFAALAAAVVSLLYFAALIGAMSWFLAVVATEFALIFGMIGASINGPTGGSYRKNEGILSIFSPFRDIAVHMRRFIRDNGGASIACNPQSGAKDNCRHS
jgi:hypothetical protein